MNNFFAGICILLTILLFIAKTTGYLSLTWVQVFCPIWIPAILILIVLILVFIMFIINN